jgi:hypothetical protein
VAQAQGAQQIEALFKVYCYLPGGWHSRGVWQLCSSHTVAPDNCPLVPWSLLPLPLSLTTIGTTITAAVAALTAVLHCVGLHLGSRQQRGPRTERQVQSAGSVQRHHCTELLSVRPHLLHLLQHWPVRSCVRSASVDLTGQSHSLSICERLLLQRLQCSLQASASFRQQSALLHLKRPAECCLKSSHRVHSDLTQRQLLENSPQSAPSCCDSDVISCWLTGVQPGAACCDLPQHQRGASAVGAVSA